MIFPKYKLKRLDDPYFDVKQEDQGLKRLMAAVLLQAVKDYISSDVDLSNEALTWIMSDTSNYNEVCKTANTNPNLIRHYINTYGKKELKKKIGKTHLLDKEFKKVNSKVGGRVYKTIKKKGGNSV